MITRHVEAVSTYAADIDFINLLITGIVGFWFLLSQAVLFAFIFKYRAKRHAKADYVDGSNPKHTRFISIPHFFILICDVIIVVFAIRVWVDVKQTPPPADATVRIVAQQWAWSFVHPGADGKLDTPDDIETVDELHIQEGVTYHYELQSRDVLHSFSVPVFRLKQDAVPGRTIRGWFKAMKAGEWDIQCAEMCGIGHGLMPARIFIETADQHAAWIASKPQPGVVTPPAIKPDASGSAPVEEKKTP